jgi:hypothetical protein
MDTVRYFFGFNRHWTVGLPDHQPDLNDKVIAASIEVGEESIRAHMERLASEELSTGKHAAV